MKKKNRIMMLIFASMVIASSAFGNIGALAAFNKTFTGLYQSQLSSLILLGVALLSTYEYWKTKQFTFLIVGALVALIVVAAPTISKSASTGWKNNFDGYKNGSIVDTNSTTSKAVW